MTHLPFTAVPTELGTSGSGGDGWRLHFRERGYELPTHTALIALITAPAGKSICFCAKKDKLRLQKVLKPMSLRKLLKNEAFHPCADNI